MSYCLNPNCQNPSNPNGTEFCSNCGTKLLIDNRYRATSFLGAGGMGRNFLAVDERTPTKKSCVIKQFFPILQIANNSAAYDKAVELFQREAATLDELGDESNQIPRLLAHIEQDKRLYFVQEFIDGQNLLKELEQRGTYNESQIYQLLTDLLPVLKFIHQRGVIHRDIKPENIMRRRDGRLVLIDFGISRELSGTVMTVGTRVGTEGYAPPEQMAYGESYPSSDIYALGTTCIHLLTNVYPNLLYNPQQRSWIWRNTLTSKEIKISNHLEKVLDKMLQEDNRQRYQSADAVLQDLQPPVTLPVIPELSSTPNHNLRNILFGGGAAILLLLAFLIPKLLSKSTSESSPSVTESSTPTSESSPLGSESSIPSSASAATYIEQGNAQRKQKNYQAALEAYTQAIEIEPENAIAYYNRGVTRDDLRDKPGALEDYNQAIQLNQTDSDFYYNRAIIRNDLRDKQGALKDYNQAIQLNPNNANYYYGRGNTRNDLGNKQGALQDYNQAIKINPENTDFYHGRGNVRDELSDQQGALEDYNQAIKLDVNNANVYYNRGLLRKKLGDKQIALEDYNRAIKLNSNNTDFYYNRALLSDELGNPRGALEDYNQAVKLIPTYANAYFNRALIRKKLEDKQGAGSDFKQAADLYQQQGKTKDYEDALEQIKKLQQ